MVGSHMHRRFGLFGTERTGAGIIKIRTISTVSPRFGVRRVAFGNLGKVEAGVGPAEATVPAFFAFSRSPSLPVRSDGHRNRQTNP